MPPPGTTSSASTWSTRASSTRRSASTGACAPRAGTPSAPCSRPTSSARPATSSALEPLRPNLRLVKGAYLEPAEIAYPRKADVDAAYARLIASALEGATSYTAIATHDEQMIEQTIALAERMGVGRDRFEFQMLYGVRPRLQLQLAQRGFKVLVATPFGPQWYPYLMRRLAERPANLLFVARNLVRR